MVTACGGVFWIAEGRIAGRPRRGRHHSSLQRSPQRGRSCGGRPSFPEVAGLPSHPRNAGAHTSHYTPHYVHLPRPSLKMVWRCGALAGLAERARRGRPVLVGSLPRVIPSLHASRHLVPFPLLSSFRTQCTCTLAPQFSLHMRGVACLACVWMMPSCTLCIVWPRHALHARGRCSGLNARTQPSAARAATQSSATTRHSRRTEDLIL